MSVSTPVGTSPASAAARFTYVLPLSSASVPITTSLVFAQTTTAAGTPLPGSLVVSNPGSAVLVQMAACGLGFGVGLASSDLPLRLAFSAVACIRDGVVIPNGTSSYPFVMQTSYESCSEDPAQATPVSPTCQPAPNVMPPLPAGSYQAEFESDGFAVPTPSPVSVTLVP